MVTKTDPCVFSEMRIFPGGGRKFVSKDGKVHYFISSKCMSLYQQRKKAVKLTWTQAWRRFNKKIKSEEVTKRRTKKTTRVQKAIVGISLDEIRRRRAEKPEERDKKIEQQKKDVKEKQKKAQESKKVEKQKQQAKQKSQAPKNQPAQKKQNKAGRK